MLQKELIRQQAEKASAADGVHMRALKALHGTTMATMLLQLFNACLAQNAIPQEWKISEVHLLQKDMSQPKTITNTRPITIVPILRKLFESLLLQQIQDAPWAQLHPAQAGFQKDCSTLTHAALVHGLLDRRLIEGVVFLDLRSAFDMVDHTRLLQVLRDRGCPSSLLTLFQGLMMDSIVSRVLANNETSPWFARTQGVLQGSPLSPWLFNIFIDQLLIELNAGATEIPQILFYADDGALLIRPDDDPQELLNYVTQWCQRNGLSLNATKCGYVTRRVEELPLLTDGQIVPQVQLYRYLGFPMTAFGIDFEVHLQTRLEAVQKRMSAFGFEATAWGPAHRLRIYYCYLQPMFEYRAPLVWAWRQSGGEQTEEQWRKAVKTWKEVVLWIAGGRRPWKVSANLLGLTSVEHRFESLHTGYQWTLQHLRESSPLQRQLQLFRNRPDFLYQLRQSSLFEDWKRQLGETMPTRRSLASFLLQRRSRQLEHEGTKASLTRQIPFLTRLRAGLKGADATLGLRLDMQETLFQYRRGVWCYGKVHSCMGDTRYFRRGQEDCECFGLLYRLSPVQRELKEQEGEGYGTEIDWLLNSGCFNQAFQRLLLVQAKLKNDYSQHS